MEQCRSHIFLLICMLLCSSQSQNWMKYTVLDVNDTFHLSWNLFTDKRGGCEITFKVEIKAKGYFGLGFSPSGKMPGSDIVTGWLKDGEVYFQDRYALSFSLPVIDYQQDYELIAAYENDTFTVFEFCRKLDTYDENDTVIDKSAMQVIYAYSEEDPESEDPFYHSRNRGSKTVLLLQNELNGNMSLNSSSLLHWDVRSPNIDISSIETLQWCKIFKGPEVSKKHHIVYVKPMIQRGNEQFAHYMFLRECVGGTSEEYEHYADYRGFECYQPNTPVEFQRCVSTLVTWAVGGEGIVLPDHIGLPLDPVTVKYYKFEIHYENPLLQTGIFDHSGLRLYYTQNLRDYESGDFWVAASLLPRVFIPPGQEKYVVVGHSNPECFGSLFPNSGVRAFASLPHAHYLARSVKVRHFRGYKELTPLADNKNYDFNYQEYRFYTEVDILPGDQITIECSYNSSQRSNVTFGGLSFRDEMCLAHILYYPRVNQYSSLSGPTYANMNKVLDTNITQEEDIYRILGSYNWTSVDIDELENTMRYSEHQTQCSVGPFLKDKVYTLKSYPKDLIP